MMWPHYKPTVTAADLLESGACIEGVTEAVNKHGVITTPTDRHVNNSYVVKAANADGSGDGSGYGSGDGYGDGYGDGDGSGYGDGYGYGYVDGDGYGCGYGSGSGDGDGDGYGYGDGYGDCCELGGAA